MKKIPLGPFLYVEDGLAKIDFVCPYCGRIHEGVLVGRKFLCECGCNIHTVPFKEPEGD